MKASKDIRNSGADRIGLGTAQFGLDYGIANSRYFDAEAVSIMRAFEKCGYACEELLRDCYYYKDGLTDSIVPGITAIDYREKVNK